MDGAARGLCDRRPCRTGALAEREHSAGARLGLRARRAGSVASAVHRVRTGAALRDGARPLASEPRRGVRRGDRFCVGGRAAEPLDRAMAEPSRSLELRLLSWRRAASSAGRAPRAVPAWFTPRLP